MTTDWRRGARAVNDARMALAVGDAAPDFTLKDQDGNDVTLSLFRGSRNVVLVFYPFTFTGVCEGELCALRDDKPEYDDADAQLLALSCDSRFAQQQWAQQQGFTFPVLSDFWPHGAVARAYGVFNEQLGCANRATFVIDKGGKIVDTFAAPDLGTAREKSSYESGLSKL
jgi:peroxiredoxin